MSGCCAEARILVVDDDAELRSTLVEYICTQGMNAIPAETGGEVLRAFEQPDKPDLVILDVRLGQENGLDVLRELRQSSEVPVIIASGEMRDDIDRIIGLELGADDYLTKPFSMRELIARIRAVLRRRAIANERQQSAPRLTAAAVCRFGGWEFNTRRRRLTDPSGRAVSLSKGEYALLVAFLNAPQRSLSREQLLQATRVHEDIYDRSIDVQILRLRRKLRADPADPAMIQTVRGVGYAFSVPVERM